jgi:hypothetical protein
VCTSKHGSILISHRGFPRLRLPLHARMFTSLVPGKNLHRSHNSCTVIEQLSVTPPDRFSLAGIFVITRQICHQSFVRWVTDDDIQPQTEVKPYICIYASYGPPTDALLSSAGCATCHRQAQLLRHAQHRRRRCSSCSRCCHSAAPDMPHPQSGCRCHCRTLGHPCQLFSRHWESSCTVSRSATCSGPFNAATQMWRHHGTYHVRL